MKKKTALIFGTTEENGIAMIKYLNGKKYTVEGIYLKKIDKNLKSLSFLKKSNLHMFPKFNEVKITKLLKKNFNEIYFFGNQLNNKKTNLKNSEIFDIEINFLKVILDHIVLQKSKKSKFLYEGNSEMYGNLNYKKKDFKNNKQKPSSLFGLSKLINYEIIKSYRKMFNIPICTVVFFNHLAYLRTTACHKILNYKKIDDYSILPGKTILLKRI
jgi:GDP-D-mannose dehydratase